MQDIKSNDPEDGLLELLQARVDALRPKMAALNTEVHESAKLVRHLENVLAAYELVLITEQHRVAKTTLTEGGDALES